MKIDIIIVTKNRPYGLLTLVYSIVGNFLKPKRIIVVDGTKKPNLRIKESIKNLCKSHGINLIYEKIQKPGIPQAKNIGLIKAKSEYVGFIDDDEIVPPNWLNTFSKIAAKNPNYGVISGPRYPLHPENYWNQIWKQGLKPEYTFKGSRFLVTGDNTFYKRNIFKKYDLKFDERFDFTFDDIAMASTLDKIGLKAYFDSDLYVYHDFRTSMKSFIKQWFIYGKGNALLHKYFYTVNAQKLSLRNILLNLKVYIYNLSWLGRDFNKAPKYLKKGFIIRNTFYVLGYLYQWLLLLFKKNER
jgi:glycosyltransferase involved in cell wall biosynthesis